METRANHVWVGTVTLVLLAGIAAFIIWLTGLGDSDRQRFDIFFKTSVDGIAKGSAVAYSGVPAGRAAQADANARPPAICQNRPSAAALSVALSSTT